MQLPTISEVFRCDAGEIRPEQLEAALSKEHFQYWTGDSDR